MIVAKQAKGREWHLARRPRGKASADDFTLVEVDVPAPEVGQVVIQNTHLSVDPYMRGRMDDVPSYLPPFPLNAPLDGGAIGVVVESRAEGFAPGQIVEHYAGLREVTVTDAATVFPLELNDLSPETYLGPLGAPGLAAWVGMTQVASVQPGETVFVTGAAGAVGSVAGQIAKLRGATGVIGSAGTSAKVQHLLDDLGFTAAFDYHDPNIHERLEQAAPDGIDVVFDNVGGHQLEAAIDHIRVGGRLVLCGMASQYDGRDAHGIKNLYELVTKRATAKGILVTDHLHRMGDFRNEVGAWIRVGQLQHEETILDGIEQMPTALSNLLSSGSSITGKAIIRVSST